MQISIADFNHLNKKEIGKALFKCCGSSRWVEEVVKKLPVADEAVWMDQLRDIWYDECTEEDYLEAFRQHPKIGDVESLKSKFASTATWAGKEQASVEAANEDTIVELAKKNEEYEAKYGHIFIVCATGKSAQEMLDLLNQRLKHSQAEEMAIAMAEQYKITLLRLQKWIELPSPIWTQVSQVTSHVLDTSLGKPGEGITIRLKQELKGAWQTRALGISNADGRVADLLPPGVHLPVGTFKMCFDTQAYFDACDTTGFYPSVDIHFQTFDQEHYHIPLLLNPFGYSTYRGS